MKNRRMKKSIPLFCQRPFDVGFVGSDGENPFKKLVETEYVLFKSLSYSMNRQIYVHCGPNTYFSNIWINMSIVCQPFHC